MIIFIHATATTDIYTLSLHDALPIYYSTPLVRYKLFRFVYYNVMRADMATELTESHSARLLLDRKSTRLNSSHPSISYAVFCLKKNRPCTATPVTQAEPHECRWSASC